PPRPVQPPARSVACAVSDGTERVTVSLAGALPLPSGARAVPASGGAKDARTADAVFVPPGYGALVRERQSAQATSGSGLRIPGQGLGYAIGGADAARALGYGAVGAVPVAATVLALLPVGVPLSITSAQRVVAG